MRVYHVLIRGLGSLHLWLHLPLETWCFLHVASRWGRRLRRRHACVLTVSSMKWYQSSHPPSSGQIQSHRPYVTSREMGEDSPAVSQEKRKWDLVNIIKLIRRPLDGGGSNAMVYISELTSKPVNASGLWNQNAKDNRSQRSNQALSHTQSNNFLPVLPHCLSVFSPGSSWWRS